MPELSGSGEAAQIAVAARKRFAAVRDDPEGRYSLAESFYATHPVPGPDRYGRSELAFMRWEIERGVLDPPGDTKRPGSPWWRKVNELILRDAVEGGMLHDAGIANGGDTPATRWARYLAAPSPQSWYLAHNSSVVTGYLKAATLATRELPAEQFLMNLVLARVLFAQALAEQAHFAIGDHPLLAAFLSDPRLPAVGIAMNIPDFYPRSYPLDPSEADVLMHRAHSHDNDALSAIDQEPCSNLEELFVFATKSLGEPELGRLHDRGLACYPQGLIKEPTTDGPRLWLPWLAHQRSDGEGRWTEELLDRMRHRADPEADTIVHRYFEESKGAGPHQFFRQLAANTDLPREECSPAVIEYFDENPPLPRWTDPEKMRLGEEFFGRWGLYVPLVLICSSLPECYGAKKGVQVLHLTARLASDTHRRIVETAQMVLDVMAPGGMDVGADGYRTVRRVRLMHAGVRYLIQNDPRVARTAAATTGPRWSPDWGVPVNQEDLAGTLTTFSWSVIAGLRTLGVPVTPVEADAYLHVWNVVGAMLGVREELLARDAADAEALTRRIRERQWGPSPEGIEMTRALVEMLDESRPGRFIPGFSGTMIRRFIGDELADHLEVPRASRASGFIRRASLAAVAAGFAQQHSRMVREMAGPVSRALLRTYTKVDRGGVRPSFSIPTRLEATWNANSRFPRR